MLKKVREILPTGFVLPDFNDTSYVLLTGNIYFFKILNTNDEEY